MRGEGRGGGETGGSGVVDGEDEPVGGLEDLAGQVDHEADLRVDSSAVFGRLLAGLGQVSPAACADRQQEKKRKSTMRVRIDK